MRTPESCLPLPSTTPFEVLTRSAVEALPARAAASKTAAAKRVLLMVVFIPNAPYESPAPDSLDAGPARHKFSRDTTKLFSTGPGLLYSSPRKPYHVRRGLHRQ